MNSGDTMQEEMFNIGKVVNTHGVKGEVKVLRITDFSERFTPGNAVYIVTRTGLEKLTIESHRVHKGFDLVRFNNYDSIEDIESFKNAYLQIPASQLTNLEEHAYYYHEIIGCIVYTDKEEKLGQIKEILAPGANDVWVIESNTGKEILIPYIEDVVRKVDIENKRVIITPMEGLLD